MSRLSLGRDVAVSLGLLLLASQAGSAFAQTNGIEGHRRDNPDGSSSVSVSRKLLPTMRWETRVGADLSLIAPQSFDRRLRNPLQNPTESSHGVAWASAVMPGGPLGIWQTTTLQARVDPHEEQGWLGTRFSRSVPVGSNLSVILEDGYGYSRPLHHVPDALTASSWETDKAVRIKVSPVHTTLSFGTRRSSAEGEWLNSISAEQRILNGLTVTGTVGETAEGVINRSVWAAFSRKW